VRAEGRRWSLAGLAPAWLRLRLAIVEVRSHVLPLQVALHEAVSRRLPLGRAKACPVFCLGVRVVEHVVPGGRERLRRQELCARGSERLLLRLCIRVRRRHALGEDRRILDVGPDVCHVAPLSDTLAPAVPDAARCVWRAIAAAGIRDKHVAAVLRLLYVFEQLFLVHGAPRVGRRLVLASARRFFFDARRGGPCRPAGVAAVGPWWWWRSAGLVRGAVG
jgi:hypothetical protein